MEMSLTSAAQNGASSSYERSPVSYVRLPFFLGQAKAAVESINGQKDCETNMAWWVFENISLIEEFHKSHFLVIIFEIFDKPKNVFVFFHNK